MLDIISDIVVLAFAVIMLIVGIKYASTIGSKGTYVSMPSVSRIWMYLPVPVAGAAMIVFELETFYAHVKSIVLGGEYMSGAVEDKDDVSEALKKAAEEEAAMKGKEGKA